MAKRSYVLIIASMLLMVGCANDYSGDTYESRAVGELSRSEYGTIVSMRKIKIKSEGEGIGTGAVVGGAAGAGAGALAGSMVGSGSGHNKLIGAAIGGLAGGVGGHMIQNRSQDGVEYTIRLDNGGTVSITQGLQPVLSVGQRVTVIASSKGRSRVVPGE